MSAPSTGLGSVHSVKNKYGALKKSAFHQYIAKMIKTAVRSQFLYYTDFKKAVASSSISASLGKRATSTQERAGLDSPKNSL